MISLRHAGLFVVALGVAAIAAWRVVATGIVDATRDPESALAWDPHDPTALLGLARNQLAEHQSERAAATARELLSAEPLAAQGFVVLAQAAEANSDDAAAGALYDIALRRAPRDLHARAWIVDRQLGDARYADALANLDILLRISPAQARTLLPVLADLAQTPAFADALVQALSARPAWRDVMLAVLLERGDNGVVDRVYDALQDQRALSTEETGRWLDWLMRSGRWGEAYSRWVGSLALGPGAALPVVYDGGFERQASGIGFDWRMRGAPGVDIERVGVAGATGTSAARVTFRHRRAPQIDFGQTLLLAPGPYRLHFRSRSDDLRSDQGIEWAIECQGAATPLAASDPLEGSSDWKASEVAFDVPAENCPAQRLWLRNPGAEGAGKIVSGTIWFDDIAIDPEAERR